MKLRSQDKPAKQITHRFKETQQSTAAFALPERTKQSLASTCRPTLANMLANTVSSGEPGHTQNPHPNEEESLQIIAYLHTFGHFGPQTRQFSEVFQSVEALRQLLQISRLREILSLDFRR
jgi:hypothetical protein